MKKLIPWESSCFSISPEFFVVWLIYSDEELLAAKRNRFAVNRTFSGRRFAGCLPFFRVGQGGVLEKQEAAAEEAELLLKDLYTKTNGGSMKACLLSSVWKILEKELFYFLSTFILH